MEVVFHFVAKAILFLCFFGFDIYPYILFHFFKCFYYYLSYISVESLICTENVTRQLLDIIIQHAIARWNYIFLHLVIEFQTFGIEVDM